MPALVDNGALHPRSSFMPNLCQRIQQVPSNLLSALHAPALP